MRRILGAKYEKADFKNVVTKQFQHLSTKEIERLLTLLMIFEYLFNGTLGRWNTTLEYLEL